MMGLVKALFVSVCAFVLSGCMNSGFALIGQDVPSESNAPMGSVQQVGLNQVDGSEPACEATWQWPSRFGDIRFQECERGSRYFVQLTQQALDTQLDLSTVSWSWHNCLNTRVWLRGSVSEFITNPPHITTCRDQGYYLLLEYNNDQGNRFWDTVWFRPGIYFK